MATRDPVQVLFLTLTTSPSGYTVPANSRFTVSAITACNTTGTARTINVYGVPNAGTAGPSNMIASAVPVPASGSAPVTNLGVVAHTFMAGQSIEASCDAGSAVNFLVSGYLQS